MSKKKIIITPLARVSYACLYKPKPAMKSSTGVAQDPKFQCDLIFRAKADLTELRKAVFKAKVEKWGADKTKWPKKLHSPFKDGNENADKPEYVGTTFITPTNKNRPYVVDGQLQPITEQSGEFYSGCFVYAALTCKAYDMKKKGVTFYLEGVQKVKNGERFGAGSSKPEDAFQELEESDTEEDEDSDDDGGF